jgi:hypothetical protein
MKFSRTSFVLTGFAILTLSSLSHAGGFESDTAKAKLELAKIVGTYQLSKTVKGNCSPSITVQEEGFIGTKTTALGIYGNQPGDVVIQLESLNAGKSTVEEENPMLGTPNGSESNESSIGNGQISGYSENDDVWGKLRFRTDFSATYGDKTLNYEVKYNGAFNGICFDNVCQYTKQ